MFGSLARDESGMALGLAIVLIVLVGVMGAGLLVFVRNDLEAVVKVNQGQKALEAADAGIQAAEERLRLDATPESYDGKEDVEDSEWSYSGAGRNIAFEGNSANVKVRYLQPSENEEQAEQTSYAPEVLPGGKDDYPDSRNYFQIVSEGSAGKARRLVESIYRTRETGLPAAWYSSGTFEWNGDAFTASEVSVFSGDTVENFRPNGLKGCDLAYKDWDRPPWNETPRSATTSTETCDDGSPAGVGAVGSIVGEDGPRPGIDYDTNTNPSFVENYWIGTSETQVDDEISYPFDPDPDSQVDLEALRAVAASGENGSRLETLEPETSFRIEDYPENSNENTVYFVEFVDPDGTSGKGDVSYETGTGLAEARGTIVVVNGDFAMSGSREYGGVILLRDPVEDDETTPEYVNTGDVTLDGFANVEGTITMKSDEGGSVSSKVTSKLVDGLGERPGFYALERWSWRECYSEDCG